MTKFIEVNNELINVVDIRRIEFLGDDIHMNLFPGSNTGKIVVDMINFNYANVVTFDGGEYVLSIDLFLPEDDETEEKWIERNRAYINESMEILWKALEPTKIDGIEYKYC